jgi:hypothetical protein
MGEMPVANAQSCDTSFGNFTFGVYRLYLSTSQPTGDEGASIGADVEIPFIADGQGDSGQIALMQPIKPMSLNQPHQAERMTTKGWLVVRRLRSPPRRSSSR